MISAWQALVHNWGWDTFLSVPNGVQGVTASSCRAASGSSSSHCILYQKALLETWLWEVWVWIQAPHGSFSTSPCNPQQAVCAWTGDQLLLGEGTCAPAAPRAWWMCWHFMGAPHSWNIPINPWHLLWQQMQTPVLCPVFHPVFF